MNPSELIAFLTSIGASPHKGLSQNFLINEDIISKFARLADVEANLWVLEIGPGTGAITQELLAQGAHVFAVEKDSLLAKHLERLQTPDRRLHVVAADFLEFPIDSLLSWSPRWKVVANLPYQITAPVLEILCQNASQFESATLIVQKEVGDRIYAKPSTKLMGSLTIFLQFYAELGGSFSISSNCFYPKPAVESKAIQLRFKHAPPPVDPALFFPLVRKAYQQRRKMLTTSLKSAVPHLGQILDRLGISIKARPEELCLEEWVQIVRTIYATDS